MKKPENKLRTLPEEVPQTEQKAVSPAKRNPGKKQERKAVKPPPRKTGTPGRKRYEHANGESHQKMTFHFPDALAHQLRLVAVHQERDMVDIVREILSEALKAKPYRL